MAFVIAVAILAVAMVIWGEWWLRARLVPLLSQQVADAMHTDHAQLLPDDGFLLASLIRRYVPHLRLVARDVPLARGQASLREVVVELNGIHLHGPVRRLNPTFDDARFTARLTWADVSPVVPLPPFLKRIDVVAEGLRLTTLAGVVVDAHVELHPGKVRVRPTGGVLKLLPTQNIMIDLPSLPLGAEVEGMELDDGTIELTGTIDTDELAAAVAS